MPEKEPTQRTEKGQEIPISPREMEEAAEQEAEYPEDETNEG
jgi:hypothetical protein